jgi:hypothetical protein
MATSSKVQFKLDKLSARAVEAIDLRIDQKRTELERLGSPEDQAERIAEWRKAQEAKISNIFSQLDSIDDVSLSRFALDKLPDANHWDIDRARRDLDRLLADRAKIVAKAESLVADAEGNVSLTKTQLREFFEL